MPTATGPPGDGDRQRHARQLLRRRPASALDDAVAHALRLVDEGADLLDIGGESSRPGAEPVAARRGAAPGHPGRRGAGGRARACRSRSTRPRPRSPAGRSRPARRSSTTSRRLAATPSMARVVAEAGAGRRPDAHAGHAPDDAGRPALRRRRRRGPRLPRPAGRRRPSAGASRGRGSRSTRGSGSARRSSTTWSSCGTSIDLPRLGCAVLIGTSRKGFLGHADRPAASTERATASVVSSLAAAVAGARRRPGPRRRGDGRRDQGLDRGPRLGRRAMSTSVAVEVERDAIEPSDRRRRRARLPATLAERARRPRGSWPSPAARPRTPG